MTSNLIGYPHASEAWNWTGHLTEAIAHAHQWGTGTGTAKQDIYALIASGLRVGIAEQGDITGKQGTGTGKAKRARATGAGIDPMVAKFDKDTAWQMATNLAAQAEELVPMGTDVATIPAQIWSNLIDLESQVKALRASRASIVTEVLAQHTEGNRILTLAGGKGFGDGRHVVTMQSSGMAARAARYLRHLRGHTPSETSLQDAAACAASAVWFEWTVLQSVDCALWTGDTIGHLASIAWRAAFRSFTRDKAQGKTGDRAGHDQAHGAESIPIDAANLELQRQSLESWARDRQGQIFEHGKATPSDLADHIMACRSRRARRDVLKWFASVLDVHATGRTGQAERARFSVLARLVFGRDIATATHAAGFASGRAALESFRSGKVWQRLCAACSSHVSARERALLGARVRAVRVAMEAIKEQRATRQASGKAEFGAPVARRVTIPSGTANARHMPHLTIVTSPAHKRTIQAQGITGTGTGYSPMSQQWSIATDKRAFAVAIARAARSEVLRTRAARVAQFDLATQGFRLRSGWLR